MKTIKKLELIKSMQETLAYYKANQDAVSLSVLISNLAQWLKDLQADMKNTVRLSMQDKKK